MTKYRTIVADPPWRYDEGWPVNRGRAAGTRIPLPYGSLGVAEVAALPVEVMAKGDAHLFLWTTNRYLAQTFGVAEAWGFRPSQALTWCKPPVGTGPGGLFANTSEFVIYARRGKPEHLQRADSTWWQWPRGGHSVKPDAFLDLIETLCPGPYLEMFARRARFGWDYWGDESLGTAEMPEAAA